MSILSKAWLRNSVGQSYRTANFSKSVTDSATLERIDGKQKYDVFLSHSYLDKETIFQLNYVLEERLGLDVFVDWIEKPELERDKVNPDVAAEMRDVMNRCSSLLYAVSTNASQSKWMPWELGYSDAKHGKIAIFPIADVATTVNAYKGQEFIGIYPYVILNKMAGDDSGGEYLWVHDPRDWNKYAPFSDWKNYGLLYDHS